MTTEKATKTNIGVVLLAAGKSSRLGQPKQLLLYGDDILLKHSFKIAGYSTVHPIIVVLGANADLIKKELGEVDPPAVVNENWQEGMASSIRCGLVRLTEIAPNSEGVVLMVCDQPYVTTDLLNNIILVHYQTHKRIVACSYENTYGPPVFFHKSMFPELLQLKGDVGARGLIKQHFDEVEIILFPKGSIDIDTEVDYENLEKRFYG